MKNKLLFISVLILGVVFFCGTTQAAPINPVAYGNLTGDEYITFEDVAGGGAPGINYDRLFESGNTTFGEHFLGQTVSYNDDFDVISGLPSGGGLTLQTGLAGENINIFTYAGSQVLTGLGKRGFPDPEAVGEGAFSLLFDFDQSQFGFQLVGGGSGSATIDFFTRSGALIDSINIRNISDAYYGFMRDNAVKDIAGLSLYNFDRRGVGFDNLRHDVAGVADPVPEPSTMLLLGSGLIGLAWYRRKAKK